MLIFRYGKNSSSLIIFWNIQFNLFPGNQLGEDGIELLQSTMEGIGKADQLGSLRWAEKTNRLGQVDGDLGPVSI